MRDLDVLPSHSVDSMDIHAGSSVVVVNGGVIGICIDFLIDLSASSDTHGFHFAPAPQSQSEMDRAFTRNTVI